jgi:hypothetical protein
MFVELLNWIHRSFQLYALLSVEKLFILEDVVQSFLDTWHHEVGFFIFTKPHTNQI